MVRKIAASAVLLTCAFTASAYAASQSAPSLIVQAKVIGGFKTSSGGFPQAQELFGNPYSSTQSPSLCIARWSNGLTIAFKRRLPYSRWSKACVSFRWAKAAKSWRTAKGLRVGSPESKMKQIYPHATSSTVGSMKKWVLIPGGNPQLQAWTKHGKVSYFAVERH